MQFEIKNEVIRFKDTSEISPELWQKMLNRINYLGYDLPDIGALKAYFDKNNWLNPDQSLEVMRVLKLRPDEKRPDKKTVTRYNAKAEREFGITFNHDLAGYILTDGSLLRMSYDGYHRNMDHREIRSIISSDDDSPSGPMHRFIWLGNIRINGCGVSMMQRPTPAQRRDISKFIRQCEKENEVYFTIDILNRQGHVVKGIRHNYVESGHTHPELLLKEIDDYFDSIEI